MVRIHAVINDLCIDADGHAQCRTGTEFDLVCCAVSYALQELVYNLEELQAQRQAFEKLDVDMDKGHMHIKSIAHEWSRPSVRRMYEYCIQGLRMLEERYPEYVELTEGAD